MTSARRSPGEVDQAYPDAFNLKAMPPQPSEKKPGQLPEEKIRQFFEQGYVIVDSFFDTKKLDECLKATELLVDEIAEMLYKGGKIKNLYKEYGVYQRLSMLETEFPGANILLIKSGKMPQENAHWIEPYNYKLLVRSFATVLTERVYKQVAERTPEDLTVPNTLGAFRDLWSDSCLLNVVEQLIGPDIMGHPVWNLRCKIPNNDATTVPWHQDAAYLDTRVYDVMQVTAWIPLLNATRENGCMEVAARGHLKGKVATHTCCWRDTWYIMLDEQEMARSLDVDLEKDIKLCEIPYGSMLLLNNMIPHRSLPNMSNEVRWSLDLRWQRPDKAIGFYDLKQGVLMRTQDQPDMKIDWDPFCNVDRDHVSRVAMSNNSPEAADPFDTIVQGAWMKQWEITNHTRHTRGIVLE